ncbi:MAG: flagellar biosynthesis protein FliQ [Alphaproteobacteria bacterium]|nr:MAG: flagellar biosynthesis protein FliQ [Alphaproteobacteria bacterium]
MTPDAVATIGREAMMTLLWISAPTMLVALLVGLLIALIQALTSIQEVTLSFVPKIILVFVVLLITMPLIASQMQQFTEDLFARIVQAEPVAVPGGASE